MARSIRATGGQWGALALAAGVWMALAGVSRGEPGATPPAIRGDGTAVPPPVEVRRLEPTRRAAPERPSLFEAIHLRLPTYRSLTGGQSGFLAQVSFERRPWIPGSVIVEYEGLQGYVVKQIENRLEDDWVDGVRSAIAYDVNPYGMSARARLQAVQFHLDEHGGGRWWDRTWYQSLPESKGGAPEVPFVHQIGRRVSVIELGPLSLTNDLRGRVANVDLFQLTPGFVYRDLDPNEPVKARDYARLDRNTGAADAAVRRDRDLVPGQASPHDRRTHLVISSDSEALAFTFTPRSDGRLLDGYHWRLKLRPRGRVALRGLSEPTGSVSLKAVFEILLGAGARQRRVAEVEAQVDYDPTDSEFEVELEFALLSW